MSHTVADIHIDEGEKKKKKLQSHLKFNRNVFVANGRDRGRKHFRLHSLLKRLFSPVAVVLGINTL